MCKDTEQQRDQQANDTQNEKGERERSDSKGERKIEKYTDIMTKVKSCQINQRKNGKEIKKETLRQRRDVNTGTEKKENIAQRYSSKC